MYRFSYLSTVLSEVHFWIGFGGCVRGGKAQGLRVSYDPPGYFVPPREWIRN